MSAHIFSKYWFYTSERSVQKLFWIHTMKCANCCGIYTKCQSINSTKDDLLVIMILLVLNYGQWKNLILDLATEPVTGHRSIQSINFDFQRFTWNGIMNVHDLRNPMTKIDILSESKPVTEVCVRLSSISCSISCCKYEWM